MASNETIAIYHKYNIIYRVCFSVHTAHVRQQRGLVLSITVFNYIKHCTCMFLSNWADLPSLGYRPSKNFFPDWIEQSPWTMLPSVQQISCVFRAYIGRLGD